MVEYCTAQLRTFHGVMWIFSLMKTFKVKKCTKTQSTSLSCAQKSLNTVLLEKQL